MCNTAADLKRTKLDKRFFESTRGRIVTLLRGTTETVNELAQQLELSDNAVRAHLLSNRIGVELECRKCDASAFNIGPEESE